MDLVSGDKTKKPKHNQTSLLQNVTVHIIPPNQTRIYIQYKIALNSSLLESTLADGWYRASSNAKIVIKNTTNTTLRHDDF